MAKYVIGIDFGEDTCVIAAAKREGGIQIIENDYKCVMAFGENDRIFGDEARNMKNAITGIKHLIGRHHNDPAVQDERSLWTSKQPDGRFGIKVDYLKEERTFSPTQITGMIFAKLKQKVEIALNTEVSDAVIGVPCFFNNVRREAVRNAARIAGLNVLEIMNETTASALAYGVNARGNRNTDESANNVVFVNAGNIALQVSVVQFENRTLTALSTSVDPHFVNIEGEHRIMDRNQIQETMNECLKNSGIETNEISDVVAVGGSSRKPVVKKIIEEVFQKQPSTSNQNEAVARGCALKAASLSSDFQSIGFDIEEENPNIPGHYKTDNNTQNIKELTLGGLIKLMKLEDQMIKAETHEKSRIEAKNALSDYLDKFERELDEVKLSDTYTKDLAEALTETKELLYNEGENPQREEFVNILAEFKKHDEMIENGEWQYIPLKEKQDELNENKEVQYNQSREEFPKGSSETAQQQKKSNEVSTKKGSKNVIEKNSETEPVNTGSVKDRINQMNNDQKSIGEGKQKINGVLAWVERKVMGKNN